MYKCIIVDDSLIDRDVLEMYIKKIEGLSIEAICINGIEAMTYINQNKIDIVF
jgi:two-component system, LytTR family, response regulator